MKVLPVVHAEKKVKSLIIIVLKETLITKVKKYVDLHIHYSNIFMA
jgi:hypothetical protein